MFSTLRGFYWFYYMSLQYICAGLSRTGTTSFHHAMKALGFVSLHYDTQRLWDVVCGSNSGADFKVYDDVDVVSDLPVPIYLSELLETYPEAKVILTVRNLEEWWESIDARFEGHPIKRVSLMGRMAMSMGLRQWPRMRHDRSRIFKQATRRLAYGSIDPQEENYKQFYERHIQHVIDLVPAERLLIMNICDGDGWEKLCPFVEREIPEIRFPFSNEH